MLKQLSSGALLLALGLAMLAPATLIAAAQQQEPITAAITDSAQISTLDPQRAEDSVSVQAIENLFLGLTNYDPVHPGNITPELAADWTVSDDGTVWTFHLRDDVPWVRWDRAAQRADVLRMVTAQDVVYGFQRACDPRLAAYYSHVAKQIVAGCAVLFATPVAQLADPDVAQRLYEGVQARALDDATFQVTLQFAAGYFFSQTPLWIFRPVPREIVEQYGEAWTEPGNLVTNGPFVLDELVRGVGRVYLRNPALPADVRGPGNVERIVVGVVADQGSVFSLYQNNQIDSAPVPSAELQAIQADPAMAGQLIQTPTLSVFYFGFATDRPPLDNVHLRRAFAAVVDRAAFVQTLMHDQGIPMIHFTPPAMFGAPPLDEIGVGYDPAFARQQMALAGYPDCVGLPPLEIMTFQGLGEWGGFLAASLERELGCDANSLTIEQQDFAALQAATKKSNAPEDRPHIWTLGWSPDYPDANNWVNDVLSCHGENDFKRPCSAVDERVMQAARATDPDMRVALYSQIEDMFFGPEGEQPIIPLFMETSFGLVKPWYTGPFETDGLYGGAHWDWWMIDAAAQRAARGG